MLYLACDDGVVRVVDLEEFVEMKRMPQVADTR